ncbi:TetR family transcriptional regulator [Cryptosporangium sp. NPDC048952]|uniref:TetR family transcriptional regulator n=1 Tax=Cryptosporangium sp. NPDC048952 TaxID=3363961 RepID=UPI0037162107
MPASGGSPTQGLRERKKARMRAEIQAAALRLFRSQGYDVTTVDQIAEAAEISRMTFFRYFPGKADVVIDDVFDAAFADTYRLQPSDLSPVQAMRSALRATLHAAAPAEQDRIHDRDLLLHTVPELRAALQQRTVGKLELLTDLVGERLRRSSTDVEVLTVAGAIIGVGQAAWIGAENGSPEGFLQRYRVLFDAALARLDAGLISTS